MRTGIPLAFMIVFALVAITVFVGILATFGGFAYLAKRFHAQWKHNRQQPLEYCSARVVTKRTHVSGMDSTSTWYHATFEFETGDRREFSLAGDDYGLLAEGDEGRLGFQGTWFRSFVRKPVEAPPVMAGAQSGSSA